MRRNLVALVSGTLFGAGLAISGMTDPARVRAFLDLSGAWDPTLAFVMGGAIPPMAIAWSVVRRRAAPFAASQFHMPATAPVDLRLVTGAALFGIGWGMAGLCPGPAIAALAIRPIPALIFVVAMALGAAIHRFALSPRRRGWTGRRHAMRFKQITSSFSVASQPTAHEIAAAAEAGFRSILSNRPDGEEPGQPSASAMADMAARHGLAFAHIPIAPGNATDADADRMQEALAALPRPTLGFCRSGTRSATLWALAEAGRTDAATLIGQAKAAGYDLAALKPALQRRSNGAVR